MKKTLVALLCTAVFSSGCNNASEGETGTNRTPPPQNSSMMTTPPSVEKEEEILYTKAPTKSFDELLRAATLTREEFSELIQYVRTTADLERIIKERKIYYPPPKTEERRKSTDLEYGAPWETHNRGYGVCDELALYALPFLLQIPTVKNISLLEISGEAKSEDSVLPIVLLQQDTAEKWHYVFKDKISSQGYATIKEAAIADLTMEGYRLEGRITDYQLTTETIPPSTEAGPCFKTKSAVRLKASTVYRKRARHALVIFQDRQEKWHVYSNGEFDKRLYQTPSKAVQTAAQETRYTMQKGIEIKMQEITSLDNWVYDDRETKTIKPTREVCLP